MRKTGQKPKTVQVKKHKLPTSWQRKEGRSVKRKQTLWKAQPNESRKTSSIEPKYKAKIILVTKQDSN